jgi:hypothetical protein
MTEWLPLGLFFGVRGFTDPEGIFKTRTALANRSALSNALRVYQPPPKELR